MTCTTVDCHLVATSDTYPHVRAMMVMDSEHPLSPNYPRLITVQVRAPRWLLAEINTHGLLSKSSQSSRAVPLKARIPQARNNPVTPSRWDGEQRGMVAAESLAGWQLLVAKAAWRSAAWCAAAHAYVLAKVGLHKQWTARVVEPYLVVETVLTATEWKNFFALRLAPDAQPEFQELARCIKEVIDASKPVRRYYHTPYVEESEHPDYCTRAMVSAARCARVSYFRSDGQRSHLADDLDLVKTLLKQRHMNPFSHQGSAVGDSVNRRTRSNFASTWVQLRKTIPGEACKTDDPVDLAAVEKQVRGLWG